MGVDEGDERAVCVDAPMENEEHDALLGDGLSRSWRWLAVVVSCECDGLCVRLPSALLLLLVVVRMCSAPLPCSPDSNRFDPHNPQTPTGGSPLCLADTRIRTTTRA